ncbi:MAG: hypothetical protein KDA75_09675 [Planctomycetaceae bacterium]|nr:hypothetical protein [Planctomycetaceae bacterium]
MPVTAYCPKCRYKFEAERTSPGAAIKCEVCGGPTRVAGEEPAADDATAAASKKSRKSNQMRCPSCRKLLPEGMKFCARCNVSATDTEGGVRGAAIVAGWQADAESTRRKNLLQWLMGLLR